MVPARGGIVLPEADEQLEQQQDAQRKTAPVHAPDGPGLRGAKRPRAEHQHRKNQRRAQIIAEAI